MGGRKLLPVVRNIGFQFPVFLIYPRQGAKDLPGDMVFRAAQRAAGEQVFHRPVVENAQNMPPLSEAAAQMRDQHLTNRGLIAHQLDQLIDTILFQQILGPLLLQRQAGIQESQL